MPGPSEARFCKVAHELEFGGLFYPQEKSWPQVAVPLVPLPDMISCQLQNLWTGVEGASLRESLHQFTSMLCAEVSI